MSLPAILFTGVIGLALFLLWRARVNGARRATIESWHFPVRVGDAVRRQYPHLAPADVKLVLQALREYFRVCRAAGWKRVSMPSQVVDVAWHEFILFTRAYQQFCSDALGHFLHHTPAEAMGSPEAGREGIRRAWRICCAREGINPRTPERLPLLFAIDAQLAIPDGFRYVANCAALAAAAGATQVGGGVYCASDIGCASGCSGEGGGDSGGDGSGGDGGGDGGGCGGGD